MKKVRKILLLAMTILTAIYLGAVVYANTNLSNRGRVYTAFEYELEPPGRIYMPEELGKKVTIKEYGNESYWLQVVVEDEYFPLQVEQPIFEYKGKLYQISQLSATPGLPESVKQWQIPIGGTIGGGWIFTGALFLKGRKRR